MSELKKRPLIIDCDPGEDDAVAIFMMMAAEEFDILGICPVNGNKNLAMTEKNTLKLVEFLKSDVPVLKGSRKAIFREQRDAGNAHGDTGLNLDLPDPSIKTDERYAWDFYYEMACKYPGELEILAIGPLTNLAVTLFKYPDFAEKVKIISIMGGTNGIGNHGNVTAEFNIWADPDSAKYVFASGIPTAMMGLDICSKAVVTLKAWEELNNAGTPVCAAAARLTKGRVEHGVANGGLGGILCDAVSAAWLIDKDLIETEAVNIDVETTGQLSEGKTVVTRFWTEHVTKKVNCQLGVDIDVEKFDNLLVDLLKKLDAKLA